MKILACHNYYQQRGGEDQFFEDEASLLESRGHEVIRFTMHNDQIADRGMISVAMDTIWSFRSARKMKALIRQHKPDVIHAVNTFPLLSPSVFYAARKMGVPVVASIQNYRSFCAQGMCFRSGKSCQACLGKIPWRAVRYRCYRDSRAGSIVVAAMQMLHRRLKSWRRCVDVICVASDFSKSKLIAAGFSESQMMLKPNFVSEDIGYHSGSGKYAVFVGRLADEKGIKSLVNAWTRHNLPYELKIIGDGPEGAFVEKAAAENPQIQWLGRLPNEEVYKWVGDAACLVFPSAGYESMPKTLIESMSVGTPVIGASVGSIPEVVTEDVTGHIFEPGDADDLARAVKKFFADPDRHDAMRGRCRDRFEERYTSEINYLQLIKMYEEAMRRRNITPPSVDGLRFTNVELQHS